VLKDSKYYVSELRAGLKLFWKVCWLIVRVKESVQRTHSMQNMWSVCRITTLDQDANF